jgi:hypothetical protein
MATLNEPTSRAAFIAFSSAQHSEENVMLWAAIKDFKNAPAAERSAVAASIVAKVNGCVCSYSPRFLVKPCAHMHFSRIQAYIPAFSPSVLWLRMQFLAPNCELEVNVDNATRTALIQSIAAANSGSGPNGLSLDVAVFDTLQRSAERDMLKDIFPRYQKSFSASPSSSSTSPTALNACKRFCASSCDANADSDLHVRLCCRSSLSLLSAFYC